jgi:hypothetical protein
VNVVNNTRRLPYHRHRLDVFPGFVALFEEKIHLCGGLLMKSHKDGDVAVIL